MGRKRDGGNEQIAKIALITAIVTLAASVVGLATKLIEWLMGR